MKSAATLTHTLTPGTKLHTYKYIHHRGDQSQKRATVRVPRTPWHKKKFSKAHALVHIPYKESHRQSANKALTQKKIKKILKSQCPSTYTL